MRLSLNQVSQAVAVGIGATAVMDLTAEVLKRTRGTRSLDLTRPRNVFSNVVPFSQSNPEEVQAIRQWGEHRAIPAGAPEAAETGVSSQSGKFRRVLVQ